MSPLNDKWIFLRINSLRNRTCNPLIYNAWVRSSEIGILICIMLFVFVKNKNNHTVSVRLRVEVNECIGFTPSPFMKRSGVRFLI